MLQAAIFSCICIVSLLRAQPVIDYLAVDEAQSRLLIYGTFSTPVSVTIDDTSVSILNWSDSIITTSLPDSGKGAGGNVIVQDQNGISLSRPLSIFRLKIFNGRYACWYGRQGSINCVPLEDIIWSVNWRIDIGSRSDNIIPFEIARSSFGIRDPKIVPWSDSSQEVDSSISLSGKVDLKNKMILFDSARLHTAFGHNPKTVSYQPLPISFDSTGFITGYVDSGHYDGAPPSKWNNRIYDQELLFPPNPKPASVNRQDHESRVIAEFRAIDNPFRDKLKFTIKLCRTANLSLEIFDELGQRLHSQNIGSRSAGDHALSIERKFKDRHFYIRLSTERGECKTILVMQE